MTKSTSPRPLDIIRIDGRWAQFWGGDLLKYLDDFSIEAVNLDDLRLVSEYRTCVGNADVSGIPGFTRSEIDNIRWDLNK